MKKPNIVFILSDDQGHWAMNCAGSNELHTPNLNRLAKNGMMFNNFFCASPVCSPARASILSGKIPSAHGVHDWIRGGNVDRDKAMEMVGEKDGGFYSSEHMPIEYMKEHQCYTELLSSSGYRCMLSGKWHLGDSLTPQKGFTDWYTIGRGGSAYYHSDMVEDGKITVEHGRYITDLITDRALTYLSDATKQENPFYLQVGYTAPHSPWSEENHPKKWIDYYKDCSFESVPDMPDHPNLKTGPVYGTDKRHENLIGYFAAISAMDEGIGKIIDKIEELGETENTLIIFTSDNGMSMGHHGVWGKGNGTFPLNMYDTAVKVPFIASYKGVIPQGVATDRMTSALDIFPTIAELLEVDGQGGKLPGKSFLPALLNRADESDQPIVVFDEYGPTRMIRTLTEKLVIRYPYGENEYFNLYNDPDEMYNLINDKAYEENILSLRNRMEEWFVLHSDPQYDGKGEDVWGGGQLCSVGKHSQRLKKFAHFEE